MSPTPAVVPVIMDIVGSRSLEDREASQRTIESTFADIASHVTALEGWEATVGDEFQAVYATVPDALRATLMLRLALPEDSDCRFGIGFGTTRSVASQSTARIQDGPGWWAARAAIDEARRREKARNPALRSWFQDPGEDAAARSRAAIINSFLLARDQVISTMNPRTRAQVSGLMLGRTQAEVARDHGVSQSAVSQALKNSGAAALISSLELLQAAIDDRR